MKRKNMLLFVLCLFLMSCSNNGPDYSGNASFVNGKIQAKIDGVSIEIPTYLASKQVNGLGDELIRIHGHDCNWCISFGFESKLGVQPMESYNLYIEMHRRLMNCDHSHHWDVTNGYGLIEGELNLTENSDKNIKGAFSYTSKNRSSDAVMVVSGSFDIATGK